MAYSLNYDEAIPLDAEALAEGAIAKTYEDLAPKLRPFVTTLWNVEEDIDNDAPRYAIRWRSNEFVIFAPDLEEAEYDSWGRATVALFNLVNEQLVDSTHRFYAIGGGNDLFGIFLTDAEAIAARKSLREKRDWPYIPKIEPIWYGQYH